MEKTKSILQKNLFPPDLIDKVVRNYLTIITTVKNL